MPRPPTCASREEVAQQPVAVLGLDALGVELDAVDRQGRVTQAHDRAVRGPRVDLAGSAGTVSGLGHQRVVAGGRERRRQAGEHAGAVVLDRAELAVHHLRRARRSCRRTPGRSPDGRGRRRGSGMRPAAARTRWQGDAGPIGVAGAGRDHDRIRRAARSRPARVSASLRCTHRLGAQLAQVVDEVVGEAVVVIDQEQHGLARRGERGVGQRTATGSAPSSSTPDHRSRRAAGGAPRTHQRCTRYACEVRQATVAVRLC